MVAKPPRAFARSAELKFLESEDKMPKKKSKLFNFKTGGIGLRTESIMKGRHAKKGKKWLTE